MDRVILVTADFEKDRRWTPQERSDELRELATSAGAKVVGEVITNMKAPHSASFIGKGKLEEIAALTASEDATLVIFNNDLSGTQQKNIEEVTRVRTIDRTQLILDIFARRARSNEGKLQVELAQLLYLMPRLTGKGVELSRLGGGIGTRGPGEQKLEVDRRRIRTRIDHLKKGLGDLSKRRAMMRSRRGEFSLVTAAIIGYTNAGKSTLLNALTNSDILVADKLFATLDPTARTLIMPNRQKVLFVDTVGFLNDLPHHLIEAFKATLEEVVEADVLLHMVDISHPKAREQSDAVYRVLEEIGAKDKVVITILNKIDKLGDAAALDSMKSRFDDPVSISALKKEGFKDLIDRILRHMDKLMTPAAFKLPAGDTRTLNIIRANGLITKEEYRDGFLYVEASIPIRLKSAIDKLLS